jgi:TolB protein
MQMLHRTFWTILAAAVLVALPVVESRPVAQQQEIAPKISNDTIGQQPRLAVPDFLALPAMGAASTDAETADVAKTISQVLIADFEFEREFALMPKDIVSTIPAATSVNDVPFDRWREVNADGVIIGSVQKTATGVRIEMRLYSVRARQASYSREYTGAITSRRLFAHQIADEIHQQQRNLRGVARTKLSFDSDRDGDRMQNTVEKRTVKEIYISDYDGENQRRVTTQMSLNITATWSPDGRSIAYSSYRRVQPQIFISNIYQGTLEELTKPPGQNFTPVWSPDGTRIAFASSRDNNFEIYVVNRDGSNARRLTNSPGADITPTWSPTGTQIAFTSDRTGAPQIYVVGVDGLGLRQLTHESKADRATWSPAPFNEIAYAASTGPGNDIKVLELASGSVRQLTFGEGTNESPCFSPNGRHIAFSSTRSGKTQIFTMARDGKDLRQVTRSGANYHPNWSN